MWIKDHPWVFPIIVYAIYVWDRINEGRHDKNKD